MRGAKEVARLYVVLPFRKRVIEVRRCSRRVRDEVKSQAYYFRRGERAEVQFDVTPAGVKLSRGFRSDDRGDRGDNQSDGWSNLERTRSKESLQAVKQSKLAGFRVCSCR